MTPIRVELVNLAYDCVHSGTQELELGNGVDYIGLLTLEWDGKKFCGHLRVKFNPRTLPGDLYNPPETIWIEREDVYATTKIKVIERWLNDWRLKI